MKRICVFLFVAVFFCSLALVAGFTYPHPTQTGLSGAWQLQNGAQQQVLLLMDGYLTHTTFDKEGKQFVQTHGGTVKTNGNRLVLHTEFDSQNKEQVGQTQTLSYTFNGNQLVLEKSGKKEIWARIDNGKAPLAGVWRITARKQEEGLVPIHQTGTRQTLKILTGTRFQWAAIDPGTKEFHGTGGGTYTFENGKYTERIEFFSRDNSRVGASLTFDGKLEEGNWHHSGLSSRGEPIYEVWSRKSL